MKYSKSLIATLAILTSSNLTATNIVTNGSFENFSIINGNNSLKIVTLDGWNTPDSMRVWTNRRVMARDGEYKLELDTHKDTLDYITQTIKTKETQNYKLCIDAYARRKRSSDFQVLIDDEVIINGYTVTSWRKYCGEFTGDGREHNLTIQEFDSQNSGTGAIIDNITLEEIDSLSSSRLNELSPIADSIIKARGLSTEKYENEWF